jgi:PAS domain S-box-containing protein
MSQTEDIYFRGLFDDAVDMVQVLARDGALSYVNAAWQDKLGYSGEEAGRLRAADLVAEAHRGNFEEACRRAGSGERVDHFETVVVPRNGRPLTVEGSCSRHGETGRILIVSRDVTDRKRAEEVVARQAADLFRVNEMLEEKDRELADTLEQAEKYREAQERAEELTRINEELKAEINRRLEAEGRIRASLREKEVLLKEIHHRVKNNLQIISSLLNLQSGQIEDERADALFRVSQDRVRSMALIHERLYQSEDLARVDFAEYVRSLVGYLARSYTDLAGRVQVETDVGDVSLGIDAAIPCGLIINELVSNALKHAFPEGGEGRIRVELDGSREDGYCLVVSDDGVGFPEGVDFRETDSLGLQLVTTLVDQLEGRIELADAKGTGFRIDFRTPD